MIQTVATFDIQRPLKPLRPSSTGSIGVAIPNPKLSITPLRWNWPANTLGSLTLDRVSDLASTPAAPVRLYCRVSPRADVPRSLWNCGERDRPAESEHAQCISLSSAKQEGNGVSDLSVIDGIGFGAADLVLATSCMRSMGALRRFRSLAMWLSSHTAVSEVGRRCCCFMRCWCRSISTGWHNCAVLTFEAVRPRSEGRVGMTLSAQEMRTERDFHCLPASERLSNFPPSRIGVAPRNSTRCSGSSRNGPTLTSLPLMSEIAQPASENLRA
jgi:hypothetical protein